MDNKSFFKTVLLLDDNQELLEMYGSLLKKKTKSEIILANLPTQAATLATERLIDIIILDVTIDYQGSPFGGLDLYKSLLSRYGRSSLLAYSQYITDDLLKLYNYNFNFIETKANTLKFIDSIYKKIVSLRKRQTCFVAMPFNKKYNRLYKTIKKCVENCFYKCIRVDQQVFTKSIIDKIFQEIEDCKFVIFSATDQNPNAFYECGHAVALDKEVITITDSYKNLPFDIRDRNSIEYKNDLKYLEIKLVERIHKLTL